MVKRIKISRCEDFFGFGRDDNEVCPMSHDGHCNIDGTETSIEIPTDCPLRKQCIHISLELKRKGVNNANTHEDRTKEKQSCS